uniref:Uncharacterized protein n=1 Tax=Oryza nivara TaxID=4536 RepID=A0A0E0IVR0_ORYNI
MRVWVAEEETMRRAWRRARVRAEAEAAAEEERRRRGSSRKTGRCIRLQRNSIPFRKCHARRSNMRQYAY